MSATPEKIAEWCVLLNCRLWPHDLPGKPNPPEGTTTRDEGMFIRGAYAAMQASADPDLVHQIWNSPRRDQLVEEHRRDQLIEEHESFDDREWVITSKGLQILEGAEGS